MLRGAIETLRAHRPWPASEHGAAARGSDSSAESLHDLLCDEARLGCSTSTGIGRTGVASPAPAVDSSRTTTGWPDRDATTQSDDRTAAFGR